MISPVLSEMAEATRLTGARKLTEATALIQRLLRGGSASAPAPTDSSAVIDMAPIAPDTAAAQPGQLSANFGRRLYAQPRTGLRETLRRLAARGIPAGLDIGVGGAVRPAVPAGASFTAESYANAAGTRAYKLYVPSNRAGQRLPLVVMLHGCTQSPDDFAAGTRMNALAEEHGCLVAYPAQSASANAQKCWKWFSPDDQRRDHGEPSLVAGITQQIMRNHPVDASRVYIAGLSAGGAAATIMGAEYPNLYAAIGVHSGLPSGAARDVPSAFAAMRQGSAGSGRRNIAVPTIVFHGDQDTTVHPQNADAVAAQATVSASRLRVTVQRGQSPGGHAYTRTVHADSSGRALCEQWTIHGAGHAWAGGSPAGSYTDRRGPDASREMLRFFFEHRHAVTEPL